MIAAGRVGVREVVEACDPRFRELAGLHPEVLTLHEGGAWLEGPLWLPHSQELLFSDIPNDRVLRWAPGTGTSVVSRGGLQNGRTLDRHGRVVACEHGGRRLIAQARTGAGTVTVLASHHAGRRLNSPNDVVAHPDGSLWFTDPDYGILSDFDGRISVREQPVCNVFRLAEGASEPQAVASAMVKPNGLAFSPVQHWLYVAESGGSHIAGTPAEIRRFQVVPGGTLRDAGVLATLDCGLPDGLAVDEHGNVWSSAGDGVHCFAPDGTLLGKLQLGCATSNLCFGGSRHDRLFITSAQRLLSLQVAVRGASPIS